MRLNQAKLPFVEFFRFFSAFWMTIYYINPCVIINIYQYIYIFAPVFVNKTNKNLIFILLWSVPRATALPC